MRKPVAALLLLIYLFNIGGQLALHQYFDYLSHRYFLQQTAKGLYNKDDLTLVEIPVDMPNVASWTEFENVSGQIRFQNISYNYVKMKLTRTMLYLMCVPNYQTTLLSHQNVIDARQTGNVPIPQKNHVPFGKLAFLGHFNFCFCSFEFLSFEKIIDKNAVQPVQHIPSPHSDIPEQPPKSFC